MEQCRKCFIEGEYGPELDSSGVCSYCEIIDRFSNVISQIGNQEKLFRERLSMFRNVGQYDCLVGFSGGKDSSYIIHRLKSYYGARVLAYTCDNGFLTEYAKNLTDECWPCSACFHILEASAWKLAYKNRIPYIVSGRTPEQILRAPDMGHFQSHSSLLMDNLAPYDKNRGNKLAAGNLQRIEANKKWLLPNQRLWQFASDDLYLKNGFSISDDFVPELLGFFLYEEHNESHIMDILERKTHWRRPEKKHPLSHVDCAAHDAAAYLYYHRYGTTFLSLEIAASIRHKKLSELQGNQLLKKEVNNVKRYPRESMLALSKVSGIHPFNIRLLPMKIRTRRYLKNRIRNLYLKGQS